jgi:hypothetical protein
LVDRAHQLSIEKGWSFLIHARHHADDLVKTAQEESISLGSPPIRQRMYRKKNGDNIVTCVESHTSASPQQPELVPYKVAH